MNAKEFKIILKNCKHSEQWQELAEELCGNNPNLPSYVSKELIQELSSSGLTIKAVDGYGGEGCGDDYWGVFSVEDSKNQENKTFFEIRGWYASFSGAEIEAWNFYKVEKVPVQKYEWHQVKE